jgi:hypothetical protein
MEVKKIRLLVIIVAILFIPISVFLFSDNTQYKQIGDTHFYLLPDWQGKGAFLYHDGGAVNGFYRLSHEGIVCDVYWNQQFIIIKCCKSKEGPIKYWYILKNIKEYNWEKFKVRQFVNKNDYELAIDSMGIYEKDMEHTDGKIPWRIHF